MTAQPLDPFQIPSEPIPAFEGTAVAGTRVRVAGMSQVDIGEDVVVSTDDRVRLVGEFRVVGVRHYVDEKTGDLLREQVLKPLRMDLCPWNPLDANDDGVIRARPSHRP